MIDPSRKRRDAMVMSLALRWIWIRIRVMNWGVIQGNRYIRLAGMLHLRMGPEVCLRVLGGITGNGTMIM